MKHESYIEDIPLSQKDIVEFKDIIVRMINGMNMDETAMDNILACCLKENNRLKKEAEQQ
ncbi:hypothetical protein [Enterococcus sp. BWR-S5]|uniref:hypothetical protein n=1 Tax=Enterococcus sp. BWR-S5 TaxID=2787714 RepID=UPI001922160F|nr:hypothetical protein [Enterococcus sp. BWR-S5]MBL1223715.1 hypothetical protein [Enterococcus sp. BWR-S5]